MPTTRSLTSMALIGLVAWSLILGSAAPALADLGDISVGGTWAFRLTRGAAGLTLEQRTVEVERRIASVLSKTRYRETGVTVAVRPKGRDAAIMVDDVVIVTVTASDAAGTVVTPFELATQWGQRLVTGLNKALPDARVHVF